MIEQAKKFAVQAHGEQKYGVKPYVVHLEAVVSHLKDYGETAQIIAYLHDVVEDTEVSYEEVKDYFGQFVADCVAIVTNQPGSSRKERKKKTYKKMAKVSGDLELALIVKAADRLANIQACVADDNFKQLDVYKSEHVAFQASVYRKGLCEDIWQKINEIMS